MRLGYVSLAGRGANDVLLAQAAALAEAEGLALAGCVQVNTDRAGTEDCDMDLRILGGGPLVRINQRLGAGSRGCKLDPGALEAAVAEVGARLGGAQVLVLNKFGKHEALGRGFRPLVGEALGQGMTVILGVNRLNLEAFLHFAGDLATELPPEPQAILDFARGGGA
ncbi:MAG: DUF2478 domain-containing protein [Paracoccaceae bacterium]